MTELQKEILQILTNSRRVMSTREIAEELRKTGWKTSARGVDNSYSFYRGHQDDKMEPIFDLYDRPGCPVGPDNKKLQHKWEIFRNMLKAERSQAGKDEWGNQRRLYVRGVLPHIDRLHEQWIQAVRAWQRKYDPENA